VKKNAFMVRRAQHERNGVGYSVNVFDPDGNRWELSFAKEN